MIKDYPIGDCIVDPINPRRLDTANLSDEDERRIAELAQSIAEHGVMTALLGRRLDDGKIGIRAGQRRLIASRRLGLEKLPVDIRDASDEEGLVEALTEQLQREDLHPLDEAAAYEELVGSPAIAQAHAVEALAVRIGKSSAYVRSRLQLRRLAPKAEAAYRAGDIDLTRAFYLARIPSTRVQEQILGKALEVDQIGDRPSARQVHLAIVQKHTFDLMKASFDPEDASLVPSAGSDGRCSTCPDNTATKPELFDDLTAGPLGVCTNSECWSGKTDAAFAREVAAAKSTGKYAKVLDAKQSAAVFDPWGVPKHDSGYVRLDDKRWDPTSNTDKTYRKIVAGDLKSGAIKPVLAKGPDGSAIELVTRKAVDGIVHREAAPARARAAQTAEDNRAAKAAHDMERELAGRLIVECVKAAATKGGDAIALRIALTGMMTFELEDEVAAAIAVKDAADAKARAAKLTLPQLRQVLVGAALYNTDSLVGGELRPELKEACKLLGVDVKAQRKKLEHWHREGKFDDAIERANATQRQIEEERKRRDLDKRIAANSSKPTKRTKKSKARA